MRLSSLLLLVFLAGLSSCDNSSNDYKKLQDTYLGDVICLEREDTTFYSYSSDSTKAYLRKGTIVKYHSKEKVDTSYHWGESVVVKSHVDKMVKGDTFILAIQKPLDSIFGVYNTDINDEGFMYGRPKMPDQHDIAEIQLKVSKVKFYWIINQKTNDIYGPLSRNEFLIKRNELGVPDKLQFNSK
ncbi:hypothetical protein [Adhaeribacter terreus]|uniref:DUF3997 domain-containing protein n=1 Tax=Adhaeribacter terreus TaxID=529703 RepID=A0ABW0EE43_9BACT